MQSTHTLVSAERMATLWAAAVSSIRTCMDAGFMETDNTAAMLVMKDYVFLTVSALSKHRFDCSPLTVRPRLKKEPMPAPPAPSSGSSCLSCCVS